MAATLDFDLTPAGLWTDPSPLEEAPPGALVQAENCVIYRPGVLEPRRGIQTAITIGATGTARVAKKLLAFDGALFAGLLGSTDRFVSLADGGTQRLINSYGGGTEQPQFTANEISGAIVRKSLYVTTDTGVVRLDSAADTTLDMSGTPIGAQGLAAALGTGVLALEANQQYGYRIVFYRLINGAKAFGAPSGRFKLVTGGAATAATVTIPLPGDLTTSDYVQVYRSKKSGAVGTEPNDEMFLAVESKVVGSGSMTLEDHTADIDLGAALYTNAGVEGLGQASYRPPKATRAAEFNGMLFLADTKGWHRLLMQLVNTTSSGAQGVAWDTFAGTIPAGGPGVRTVTAVTPNPTSLASGSVVGRYVSEVLTTGPVAPGTNFAPESKIVSVTGTSITVDKDLVGAGTGAGAPFHAHAYIAIPTGRNYYFGSAQDVTNRQALASASDALATVRSLAHVVNMDTNAAAQAWVNVGVASGTQAAIQIESRTPVSSTQTGIRAYPGAAWSPKPEDASDAVVLDDQQRSNRLAWSKLQQPEAFPVLHYVDVGSEKHAIRALAKTREALFIFKADGVWRMTGRTPADLRLDPFDQTLVLLNPEAIVEHQNRIFCWTNKGIVAVDDSGVMPLSDPAIATSILDLERDLEAAPSTSGMWAAASESDDYVLFGLPANTTDGYCTRAYWLNTRLMQWTRWNFNESRVVGVELVPQTWAWSAAIVDPADGLLCLAGQATDAIARKEVDSGSYQHSDTAVAVTVASVSGSSPTQELTFSAAVNPNVGDLVVQGAIIGVVTLRTGTDKAIVRSTGAFSAAAATLYYFITDTIEWAAKTAPAPNVLKEWLGGCLSFERLSQVYDFTIGFKTPQVQAEETVTHTRLDGIVTSDFAEEVEFWPTRGHSIATRLIPKVTIKTAGCRWALSGLVLEAVPMTTTAARTR